jgi:DNA-binding transcriptional MerR regulator
MITIGQLARYAGVSTKTVRVYHEKGLLPEPDRDPSGYRRYTAQHVIDLIKIRTLVEAGVPLARIRDLKAAPEAEFEQAVRQVDLELTDRIAKLRSAQRRLRQLAAGYGHLLPAEVNDHIERLPGYGFSQRWAAMEADLWILAFATHPDTAIVLFRDQAEAMGHSALREIYLDYDRAYDLDPDDPRLADLAGRIVAATRQRYDEGELPGQRGDSDMPALVQAAVNASSPAWERLDRLIREQLRQPSARED